MCKVWNIIMSDQIISIEIGKTNRVKYNVMIDMNSFKFRDMGQKETIDAIIKEGADTIKINCLQTEYMDAKDAALDLKRIRKIAEQCDYMNNTRLIPARISSKFLRIEGNMKRI